MKITFKAFLIMTVVICSAMIGNTKETKELTIWAPWSYDIYALEKIAKQFGYRAKFVKGDSKVSDAIQAAPESLKADLVILPDTWLSEEILGILEPPEILPENQVIERFSKISREALSSEGQLYGLPLGIDTPLLIYNRDLLKRVGLNPNITLESLEDLIDYSARINSIREKCGFIYDADNVFLTSAFFSGFGVDLFSKDAISSTKGVMAAKTFLDLIVLSGLEPKHIDYEYVDSQFKEGNAGIIINGSWSLPSYQKAGINYGVAKVPTLPNREYAKPFISVNGIFLNESSSNKDKAVEFLRLLSQPSSLIRLSNLEGRAPCLSLEYLKKSEMLNSLESDLRVVADQARFGILLPSKQQIDMFLPSVSTALHKLVVSERTKVSEYIKRRGKVYELIFTEERDEFPQYYDEFLEGKSMRKQGKFALAIEILTNVVNQRRNFFLANYNLGLAYEDINNKKAAEKYYRRASELEAHLQNRDSSIHDTFGFFLLRDRKYKEARDAYLKALEVDKNHPKALRGLHFLEIITKR